MAENNEMRARRIKAQLKRLREAMERMESLSIPYQQLGGQFQTELEFMGQVCYGLRVLLSEGTLANAGNIPNENSNTLPLDTASPTVYK